MNAALRAGMICKLPNTAEPRRSPSAKRRVRRATREEVFEFTGLEPGSIPPFGSLPSYFLLPSATR